MKRRWLTKTCSICNAKMQTSPELWTLPTGEAVEVDHERNPSAYVKTSVGEFEICEACYVGGLPTFFSANDLAEIHFQFGLDYNERGNYARARESIARARQTSETANILAALANAEDSLGHRDSAIAHYERALELEPEHFISRANLTKLRSEA